VADEEIDVVEFLNPSPASNSEIGEAQEVLGPDIGTVGGIEPTHF
jgi:hypothetical protein